MAGAFHLPSGAKAPFAGLRDGAAPKSGEGPVLFRLVSFPRDGHATANGVLSDYFTRTVSAAECAVNSGAYMHWMVARPPEKTPRCCTR